MALAIPPPVSPTGTGNFVKKFQLSELAPLTMSAPKIKNRTATVATVHTPVRVSITALTNLRLASIQRLDPFLVVATIIMRAKPLMTMVRPKSTKPSSTRAEG